MKTPEEILIENRVLVKDYDPTKKFQFDINLSRDGWIKTIEQIIKSMIEYADQGNTKEKMSNFIQWKNTDICMDFYCECGHQNHYDGQFAYHVICAKCRQIYKLATSIKMEKVDSGDSILESI